MSPPVRRAGLCCPSLCGAAARPPPDRRGGHGRPPVSGGTNEPRSSFAAPGGRGPARHARRTPCR